MITQIYISISPIRLLNQTILSSIDLINTGSDNSFEFSAYQL